jgi:glutathione peroxidase
MEKTVHSYRVKNAMGQEIDLASYKGKVLLIVNTASRCGFTPQYKGLEELYRQYHQKGLEILAFPCNQFGQQEPGNETEILSFCEMNYQTTFPIMAKIDVNGDSADPLFQFLKEQSPGLLGTQLIKWNFTKFLVDKTGKPIHRYAPQTTPMDLSKDIEAML